MISDIIRDVTKGCIIDIVKGGKVLTRQDTYYDLKLIVIRILLIVFIRGNYDFIKERDAFHIR